MGGNGGKWRKMGGNGKLLQIHHGKCMQMFQQERKMEENGVEMGGKWVKNGTRAGPIFPIFPKGNLLPHRAVNKKPSIQVSGWKNGENGGIRRYPENRILPRLDIGANALTRGAARPGKSTATDQTNAHASSNANRMHPPHTTGRLGQNSLSDLRISSVEVERQGLLLVIDVIQNIAQAVIPEPHKRDRGHSFAPPVTHRGLSCTAVEFLT